MKGVNLSDFPPHMLGPTAAEGMAKLLVPNERPACLPMARHITLIVDLPIVVKSEANIRNGARAKMARTKQSRETVAAAMPKGLKFGYPVFVTLTRLGSKRLDSDNLATAFKAVRDGIADWLGVDDGDESKVRWIYNQKPSYTAGIRIQVTS